ncbi:MAG: hypothetical protein HY910_08645 [Desulfarculus sp.]|nr:hypothetical protein [Desulfarculus sp.]
MTTGPGDIVLIHHKGHAVTYARVEEITTDVKPGWWQVRLLFLQVPSQEVTWILREEYIDGGEFTMGGDPIRLEKLPPAASLAGPPEPPPPPSQEGGTSGAGGKVVSLAGRKGKPH